MSFIAKSTMFMPTCPSDILRTFLMVPKDPRPCCRLAHRLRQQLGSQENDIPMVSKTSYFSGSCEVAIVPVFFLYSTRILNCIIKSLLPDVESLCDQQPFHWIEFQIFRGFDSAVLRLSPFRFSVIDFGECHDNSLR